MKRADASPGVKRRGIAVARSVARHVNFTYVTRTSRLSLVGLQSIDLSRLPKLRCHVLTCRRSGLRVEVFRSSSSSLDSMSLSH